MKNNTLQRLIQEAYCKLKDEALRVQSELNELREGCTHPDAAKEHKSNTGNYDPSSDGYWTEFKCPDCGKQWSEEGSK